MPHHSLRLPRITAVRGTLHVRREGKLDTATYTVLADRERDEIHVALGPCDDPQALFQAFAGKLLEMLGDQLQEAAKPRMVRPIDMGQVTKLPPRKKTA